MAPFFMSLSPSLSRDIKKALLMQGLMVRKVTAL
jgi:hypothetical protein